MSITSASRKRPGLVTVLGFIAVFVGGFAYFWAQTGGSTPGGGPGYEVSFRSSDIKNQKERGDVTIAGVVVGRAERISVDGDKAKVTLSLNPEAVPLHEGATARIGMKSVTGQSQIDITDGQGNPIPSGGAIPDRAVKPSVDVDELLSTFDPKTRASLGESLKSAGAATSGTGGDTQRLVTGLGMLGREGHTALDAIAAQSDDLSALTRESTALLDTLDTGRGQIAGVVHDARDLTKSTSGQRDAIETTMRRMPHLLGTTREATGKVTGLSRDLAPVASDLNAAAPALNDALRQLPPATKDLRGLLPSLDGALDRAPGTLDRVPALARDVRGLAPGANEVLRDVNPMLNYLRPYGRDVGAMLASFGASMDVPVENGLRPIRLGPVVDSASVKGVPVPLQVDPLHWNNPYPGPGMAGSPAPWRGVFPRIDREPR